MKTKPTERLGGASNMVRVTALSSPFLLGFDQIERALDKATRSGTDGYPPYNIERIAAGLNRLKQGDLAVTLEGLPLEFSAIGLDFDAAAPT